MKYLEKIHFFLWSIKMFFVVNIKCKKYKQEWEKIKQFQGRYIGKRCFVIGNGPSLTVDDLNRIDSNGDYSFASNLIFNWFKNTDWRPTFYTVCDDKLYYENQNSIDSLDGMYKFLPLDLLSDKNKNKNYYFFARYPFKFIKKYPKFECDLLRKFGEGNTVTYHMLQLAVAMGFTEIYLLGCDFNYSIAIDTNGKIVKDETVKNYPWEENAVVYNLPNLQANLYAYNSAETYTKSHNIKICNATRGGKLEVFQRINFDDLFAKIE